MNNKTVEKFDFTIKLREDRVYDLYFDGKWVCSCGSSKSALDVVQIIIEDTLSKTQKEKCGWWNFL